MAHPPRPFDLASRYVKLDADDRGREVEVDPQFWPQIDHRPEYSHGRLVMVFEFEKDWPTWEIHPAGEELVCVLEGEMRLILRRPEGDVATEVRAGDSVLRGTPHHIVPARMEALEGTDVPHPPALAADSAAEP